MSGVIFIPELEEGPRWDLTNLPVPPLSAKDFFYWSHINVSLGCCARETALCCANEAGILWHDLHCSGFASSGKLVGFQ